MRKISLFVALFFIVGFVLVACSGSPSTKQTNMRFTIEGQNGQQVDYIVPGALPTDATGEEINARINQELSQYGLQTNLGRAGHTWGEETSSGSALMRPSRDDEPITCTGGYCGVYSIGDHYCSPEHDNLETCSSWKSCCYCVVCSGPKKQI